jgi:hypothetical protein
VTRTAITTRASSYLPRYSAARLALMSQERAQWQINRGLRKLLPIALLPSDQIKQGRMD